MKSVLLKGPGEVVSRDTPVPEISAEDMVITEHPYSGDERYRLTQDASLLLA